MPDTDLSHHLQDAQSPERTGTGSIASTKNAKPPFENPLFQIVGLVRQNLMQICKAMHWSGPIYRSGLLTQKTNRGG